MNPDIDDDVALISHYYPYDHFVPEQQDTAAPENQKPRRRRRRSKKEEEGVTQKRKLTEEQVIALERCFETEHKLESERKDRLAAELGLDPRQVAVWFQNRRVRWKSKKMEEEYSKLRSEQENTIVEKCRLESQVLKLQEQLGEAEKEIRRLSERDGFSSNSPNSSFSMEQMGLETVFGMPQYDYDYDYNYEYEYAGAGGGGHEMEWKSIFN